MNPLLPSYSFDDVLMRPRYSTITSRKQIKVETKLKNKNNEITLKIPIISAPMDTVTEKEMAISIALQGGLGIIHRFMEHQKQCEQIRSVKRHLQYIFTDPITIMDTQSLEDCMEKKKERGIKTLCVTNAKRETIGLFTNRDLIKDLEQEMSKINVTERMTPFKDLNKLFLTEEKFKRLMSNKKSNQFHEFMNEIKTMMLTYRIQKVPIYKEIIVGKEFKEHTMELLGITTWKSIQHYFYNTSSACLDEHGSLCVGAAVGIKDETTLTKVRNLVEAGADLICVDVANGHNERTLSMISCIRKEFPELIITGGNVVTADGVVRLARAGCNCIRVGIGNGSICSTPLETGIGFGQWSAVSECSRVIYEKNIKDVVIISDGGSLGKTGNKTKALACGASVIMVGRTFAGCDESPGKIISRNGKLMKYYRGMASTMASISKNERIQPEEEINRITSSEGVDGLVDCKGLLKEQLLPIIAGIRSGMSYLGVSSLPELHELTNNNKIEWALSTSIGLNETGIRVKTL